MLLHGGSGFDLVLITLLCEDLPSADLPADTAYVAFIFHNF